MPFANVVVLATSPKLVAFDAAAAALLKIDATMLGSDVIKDRLQQLSATDWNAITDQNDKDCIQLETTIRVGGESDQPVRLRRAKLRGVGRDEILLSFEVVESVKDESFYCDPLTGFSDRRGLESYGKQLRENRSGQSPFALMFMDLDRFKAVNDHLGHTVGDRVLATLAQRWRACLRDDDLIVRYGGDEFVVMLSNVENRDAAGPIIERIQKATKLPVEVDGHRIIVGVTIGLAIADTKGTTLDQLITAADRDMYAQKPLDG